MLMARYAGTGMFPRRGALRGALKWHCEAYWEHERAPRPVVVVMSLKADFGHAGVSEAQLKFVAGLDQSGPQYMMDAFKMGGGIHRQKAKVDVTIRCEGGDGGHIFLSGRFRERGVDRRALQDFVLEGVLVELGEGHPPVKKAAIVEGPCQVKHLAVLLEPMLKNLADEVNLPRNEAEQFQKLFAEYRAAGRCSPKHCRPGTCSLRTPSDWIAFHGYRDMKDALDFEKSGLHTVPPRLRKRPGVETLKLTNLRQPGHYNP